MTKFPGSGCCWSLEVATAVCLISIAGITLLVLSNFTRDRGSGVSATVLLAVLAAFATVW